MTKKHEELFARGVVNFIDPENNFQKKVEAKIRGEYTKDIVIKLGADPTRPDIHIGHAVILRKLRAFQDAGCKVIFLVGDYTTQIGDPTGKSKVRPEISQAEIEANMKTYIDQIGKILNTDPLVFSWIRNSDWFLNITDINANQGAMVTIAEKDEKKTINVEANSFVGKATIFEESRMQKTHLKKNQISTVSFSRVLSTLRHITHSRLIERDMFKDRINKGEELYMHEMLYPVMQGIDSSVLANIYGSCDLEIGGTDQLFNMLMGRDVMRMNRQEEQAVMAMDLLEGLDGKEKMSKSLDNYIGITDEPNNMYGKVMSIPDELITRYFSLASYTPLSEVDEIKKSLEEGDLHPKEAKMRLAKEIVAIYHGEKAANDAEQSFTDTFSKGKIPESVLEISFVEDESIVEALIRGECAISKTEARRLVESNAVTLLDTDEKVASFDEKTKQGTYRVGKHRFFKIV
jgi:tyrosyl-tRNA synthetase